MNNLLLAKLEKEGQQESTVAKAISFVADNLNSVRVHRDEILLPSAKARYRQKLKPLASHEQLFHEVPRRPLWVW